MSDVFTKTERSAVMARIRGTGNKDTELRLIALMRAVGIGGWRRGVTLRVGSGGRKTEGSGQRAANGKHTAESDPRRNRRSVSSVCSVVKTRPITIRPDFVFRKQRLAVFVDGCFFHGCPTHATWPKQNAEFWRAKIEGNRARDRRQTRLLRAQGWRVVRIWEHALTPRLAVRTIARLRARLAEAESVLTA